MGRDGRMVEPKAAAVDRGSRKTEQKRDALDAKANQKQGRLKTSMTM